MNTENDIMKTAFSKGLTVHAVPLGDKQEYHIRRGGDNVAVVPSMAHVDAWLRNDDAPANVAVFRKK